MPRRDIEEQVSDLAAGNRFEVLYDGVDVPAGYEGRGGLDDRPRLADELPEAARSQLRVDFVPEARPRQQ